MVASGLGLDLGLNPIWIFERFGPFLFAVAGGLTYYLPNVDVSTVFVPSLGAPPQARYMGRVGDMLMMGNLVQDIDASFAPYRIRWSAFNNPVGPWIDDVASQSGSVDMDPSYGEVTAVAGGRYGLICQRDSVSRISYTGGNAAFAKELIEEQRGCIAPASVVRVGSFAFGLGRDGFWQSNGASVQLISSGRVWEWFQENADAALVEKTQAAIDYKNRCIWWNFFSSGSSNRQRQLIWSWDQNKWTYAAISADWLFSSRITGALVDSVPLGDALVDSISDLVDSPAFSDGERIFSAFFGTAMQQANGLPIEAVFETGEFQPSPGYRSMIRGVAPMVEGDASDVQISIGTRRGLASEPVSYSQESSPGPQGFAPQRRDGRYIRARMRIPAGEVWSKASAMQVDFVESGRA
ncbi:MAG: hypothetical protein ACRCXM_04575 [Beijerinckiaceae bacterium]